MTDPKFDDDIMDAIKPVLDRYVKEHPEANEPGFFAGVFIGFGVKIGIMDGLADSSLLDLTRKTTFSALAERKA